MDDQAPPAPVEEADRLVRLLHASGAAERERAYAELMRLEAEHEARGASTVDSGLADIAVACASPLCEVLSRPVAEVGVEEFRRASLVLTAISGLDPARVGGECMANPDTCNLFNGVYVASDSALGAVLAKEPSDLTLEDALTVAHVKSCFSVQMSHQLGWDANIQAAGTSPTVLLDMWMPNEFMAVAVTPSDDRNLALLPLLLELLKAPDDLPDFVLSGVLFPLAQGIYGRTAVAAKLVELDAIGVLMSILRRATPTELVAIAGHARKPHGIALWVFKELVIAAYNIGIDLTAELLSCGFVDILVSTLSAIQQLGEEHCHGFNVCVGILWMLKDLQGEALDQIEDKIREVPSALRYVIHSKLGHLSEPGMTCSCIGTVVAANLYAAMASLSCYICRCAPLCSGPTAPPW
jgi:hypothetical protein